MPASAQELKPKIANTQTAYSKGLLSVSKASKILGISPSTLRRLEAAGNISSTRQPNGYRTFLLQDVQNLKVKLQEKKAAREAEQELRRQQLTEKRIAEGRRFYNGVGTQG